MTSHLIAPPPEFIVVFSLVLEILEPVLVGWRTRSDRHFRRPIDFA
jgi:hypothetical protein